MGYFTSVQSTHYSEISVLLICLLSVLTGPRKPWIYFNVYSFLSFPEHLIIRIKQCIVLSGQLLSFCDINSCSLPIFLWLNQSFPLNNVFSLSGFTTVCICVLKKILVGLGLYFWNNQSTSHSWVLKSCISSLPLASWCKWGPSYIPCWVLRQPAVPWDCHIAPDTPWV